ncbi:MAG: hypothetical protein PHO23_02680, partial [Candidatus Pacebacteria bacterium]|nr:hypothetical protein [Candidatus Paceibacterota bacterium]
MSYQNGFFGENRNNVLSGLPEKKKKSLSIQMSIHGIIRTIFLKRLESSVYALKKSIMFYRHKIKIFEEYLDKGKIIKLKDCDLLEKQLLEDSEGEDLKDFEVFDIKKEHIDEDQLRKDLEIEKKLIKLILKQIDILSKDKQKVIALKKLLKDMKQENCNNGKVLLFSYFADTSEYLKDEFEGCDFIQKNEIEFLSSRNRKDAENFASRFSPEAKNYDFKFKEKELKYLFSTDI